MKTIMKKSIKSLMVLAVAFMGISTAANAEALERNTVYVIKHMGSGGIVPLGAYKVEGDSSLTDVGTKNISTGGAAVGLAVCDANKLIFMSHESSGIVDVVDAETFKVKEKLTIPGTSNIAGMVFSEGRKRLYAVDRRNPHIFVYAVNAEGNLTRVLGEEFNAAFGAWGVDVWDNKLYCTHSSAIVTVYDLDTKLEVDRYTTTSGLNMAIAVDGSDSNHTLVYTTWTSQGLTSSRIVTQYDVNDDVEKFIDLGRDGRGLSVNPAKGLVYAVAGDNSDGIPPVLRTYRESDFNDTASIVTPLDEDLLDDTAGWATDVFASGVTYNPEAYIEMIDPADKNVTVGMDVTFKVTIRNSSSEHNMTLNDMDNLYNTNDISFVSSSLTPDNTTDDGNISWSELNITIAPDGNYTFTKTFTALREVNCTTETIQVTKAELDTLEIPTPIDPFSNTLTFDIGAACGCVPELEERDSGSTLGVLSALMLAMFTLLFGSLAMRRKRTN